MKLKNYIKNVESFRTSKMNESINDKNLFKMVFLAGGPGSGKSFVGDLVLSDNFNGFKIISSDKILEFLLKKNNLPLKMDKIGSPILYSIQQGRRNIAKKKTTDALYNLVNGLLPLYIDGTGRDLEKITKTRNALMSMGYDTSMVFVSTELEVALDRNSKRDRTLDTKDLIQSWEETDSNKQTYKKMFGTNFVEIKNNQMVDLDSPAGKQLSNKLFKIGQRLINRPLENKLGLSILELMADNNLKYLEDFANANINFDIDINL